MPPPPALPPPPPQPPPIVAVGRRTQVLWSNSIGGAGITSLGHGLAANKTLQILDMGDNRVDEAVLALKEALLANTSLHTLGLANAHLGEEGGVTMAEVPSPPPWPCSPAWPCLAGDVQPSGGARAHHLPSSGRSSRATATCSASTCGATRSALPA